MTKIAVIGASGHIGFLVAKHLKEMGCNVIPVVRNSLSKSALLSTFENVEMLDVDPSKWNQQEWANCDTLINSARLYGEPSESPKKNADFIELTMRAFQGERYIYFSSVGIYGEAYIASKGYNKNKPKLTSTYAHEKYRAESACRKHGKHIAQKIVIRVGHVFGDNTVLTRTTFGNLLEGSLVLPYSGNIPSNTIYYKHLVRQILAVINGSIQVDSYTLMDAIQYPSLSWREFYNIHAMALGLGEDQAFIKLDNEASKKKHEILVKSLRRNWLITLVTYTFKAIVKLELNTLKNSEEFMRSLSLALRYLPAKISKNVMDSGVAEFKRSKIAANNRAKDPLLTPLLFGDELVSPAEINSKVQTDLDKLKADLFEFAKIYKPNID